MQVQELPPRRPFDGLQSPNPAVLKQRPGVGALERPDQVIVYDVAGIMSNVIAREEKLPLGLALPAACLVRDGRSIPIHPSCGLETAATVVAAAGRHAAMLSRRKIPFAPAQALRVTLGRAAAIYPCCLLFAGSGLRVSARHRLVLFWDGLRARWHWRWPWDFRRRSPCANKLSPSASRWWPVWREERRGEGRRESSSGIVAPLAKGEPGGREVTGAFPGPYQPPAAPGG